MTRQIAEIKKNWALKDTVMVLIFVAGVVGQVLVNYRSTELKVQHLYDTKVSYEVLNSFRSEMLEEFDEVKTSVHETNLNIARLEEQVRLNSQTKRDG